MAEKSEKLERIDIELLNKAMEAFNAATVKLQLSYDLLQDEARKLREEIEDKNRKLSDMTNLLESVLNNTKSSIIVVNNGDIIIRNSAGDKLLSSMGEQAVLEILNNCPHEGVYDHEHRNDMFFRISVGSLQTNDMSGAVYVIDDISNIKKLEKDKQQSEKLTLIGEMAANIAHDIRNPLGSMEIFTTLLERDTGANPEHRKLTSNILKSIKVINGIISNTLLFTKEIDIVKEQYYLVDIVDEVVLYLQHILKDKRVSIVNKLSEDHIINCDKDLFRQVVMNIIHNAADAVLAESGVVTLESYQKSDHISFLVRDNGVGIDENMVDNLFLPFQTTKAKGTGLGLSIAYKIIKAHGGNITVSTHKNIFTEFTITMPLT